MWPLESSVNAKEAVFMVVTAGLTLKRRSAGPSQHDGCLLEGLTGLFWLKFTP
jgi:hypothetical protein